ncbi:MAG: Gx transporter family protein [Deltaproteobacteria bacterium]|nr:Gx transporter family protein [Deltaproteobacteria bacterium]
MPSPVEPHQDTARLARLGLLMALAGVLQALEGLVPLPIPWFRVGLANALVLAALHRWGWRDGLWVGAGKVVVGGLLSGRLFAPPILLSLGGTFAATLAMAAALGAAPPLGLVGISVVGAQAHALAQVAVAATVVVRSAAVWSLAPLLGLLAAATGVVTGLVAHRLALALGDTDPGDPGAEPTPRPPAETR